MMMLNGVDLDWKQVKELLENLSPEELEELLFELDDYEEKPVDIETFVTHPDFLGNYFEGGFRKFWLERLKEIYPTPYHSPYWLVILRGAIGLGKTTLACTGIAYDIYRLLCMRSPQKALGVIESTKIVFAIMNMTLGLATDVVWDKLSRMFGTSPWFTSQMAKMPRINKESLFPKRIDIFVGSRIGHTLGKDVIGAIIDEANFEVLKGQVQETFTSLLRRIQSRFMQAGGVIPGRIWIVSSESEKGAALNKLADQYRKKRGVCEIKAALWEVIPERYSGRFFKVFVGSETRPPEVITEQNQKLIELEPDRIIDVPIEHWDDFTTDIHAALRDLAGYSTSSSYKLFRLRHKVVEALSVTNIFPDEISLDFDDEEDQIQNYLLYPDYFRNPLEKNIPRCIHIDIGLSGDRLGIAASFVSGFKERVVRDPHTFEESVEVVPIVVTEWCLGIKAKPGQQIPLYKIRQFLNWLSMLGYPIDTVTCDGFQSADMLQWVKKAGFTADLYSVDRTSLPYLQFRSAIYEGLQVMPRNEILKKELLGLELSPDGKKVDHPDKFSDGEKGSKDIADAVCGSSCVVRERADNYKMLFVRTYEESMSSELKEMFWGEYQ